MLLRKELRSKNWQQKKETHLLAKPDFAALAAERVKARLENQRSVHDLVADTTFEFPLKSRVLLFLLLLACAVDKRACLAQIQLLLLFFRLGF